MLAAASMTSLPVQLGEVFYTIVLPVLLIAAVGFIIQRRLNLDMATLANLNFYFTAPGMMYFSLVSSQVNAAQIAQVVGFTLGLLAALAVLTSATAALLRIRRDRRPVLLMSTLMYNAGNYGLPLQELAYRSMGLSAEAVSLQVFVMLVQNFIGFTVGVFLAASGRADRRWRQNLLQTVKFPPVYAMAAALLTIQARTWLGGHAPDVAHWMSPLWYVAGQLRQAYVPLALATLGAQLALMPHGRSDYPVSLSLLLRLAVSPLLGLGLIYLLDLHGFTAQVLLISTAAPTAVNCALLCLQFQNHPNFAARVVFFGTLLSPVTVTGVIFLAQGGFLQRLMMHVH
jgi:hypothetical protein